MKQGTCFLNWDETNGKKGSSEIDTCLLNYINSISPDVEHIVLYADTWNRNQNILASLIFAMNKHEYIECKNLKKIDLKLMESEHKKI